MSGYDLPEEMYEAMGFGRSCSVKGSAEETSLVKKVQLQLVALKRVGSESQQRKDSLYNDLIQTLLSLMEARRQTVRQTVAKGPPEEAMMMIMQFDGGILSIGDFAQSLYENIQEFYSSPMYDSIKLLKGPEGPANLMIFVLKELLPEAVIYSEGGYPIHGIEQLQAILLHMADDFKWANTHSKQEPQEFLRIFYDTWMQVLTCFQPGSGKKISYTLLQSNQKLLKFIESKIKWDPENFIVQINNALQNACNRANGQPEVPVVGQKRTEPKSQPEPKRTPINLPTGTDSQESNPFRLYVNSTLPKASRAAKPMLTKKTKVNVKIEDIFEESSLNAIIGNLGTVKSSSAVMWVKTFEPDEIKTLFPSLPPMYTEFRASSANYLPVYPFFLELKFKRKSQVTMLHFRLTCPDSNANPIPECDLPPC